MSGNQNPTWYDILGVGRGATPEEVKAAWRAATDKFEPGSGTSQFRLFNEAADVLLDPARRVAYDADLDAASGVDVTKAEAVAPAEPVEPGPVDAGPVDAGPAEAADGADVVPVEPGPAVEPGDAPAAGLLGRLAALPLLVLAVLGVVAVASIVLAAVL